MDSKKIFATLSLLILSYSLMAQELHPKNTEVVNTKNYYYQLDDEGNPLFKQVISWKDISGSFAYELIILNQGSEEVYRDKSSLSQREVSLSPGNYEYSIIVYNLLDRPEVQSDWYALRIIKAEQPTLKKLSPENLYIEEATFQLTLQGDNLLEESEYWVVKDENKKVARIVDFKRERNGNITIDLPMNLTNPGVYSILVVNPGGLSSSSQTHYRISYIKPFDVSLSLGYNPFVPLYDSWFMDNWDSSFYPGGLVMRGDWIFLKRDHGQFGIELQGAALFFTGGIEEATIDSSYLAGGLNLLYKYPISSRLHAILRLGGGMAQSDYTFDYEGITGANLSSTDLYVTGGVAMQYYFNRYLFLEGGVDVRHIAYNSHSLGGISPFVSMGLAY